jgi:hypothetical protein
MIAHAGVALDHSTARTCLAWGAKAFLKARLTTIDVTANSTGESRSRCTIERIDEIAALCTLHHFSRKIHDENGGNGQFQSSSNPINTPLL